MEETCKLRNATVRIHGAINQEKIKEATTKFLKEVERRKKKIEKGA